MHLLQHAMDPISQTKTWTKTRHHSKICNLGDIYFDTEVMIHWRILGYVVDYSDSHSKFTWLCDVFE